ncbi:hypothetical protein O0L34_g17679 [Tuta absoluta]|nr:hypothetical protein O0L34_g17679 [Tuta absoluta]
MCRSMVQIVSCIMQSFTRIILMFLLMVENVIKMIFMAIYNILQFIVQCVSILPFCCVFIITSKLCCFSGCGSGCGSPGGGGGIMKCILGIIMLVITYLILDHFGVMKDIFKHLGYQKVQKSKNTTKLPLDRATFLPTDSVSTSSSDPQFSDFFSKLEEEESSTSLQLPTSSLETPLQPSEDAMTQGLLPTEKYKDPVTKYLHGLIPTETPEYATYESDIIPPAKRINDSTETSTLSLPEQEPKTLMRNLSKRVGLETYTSELKPIPEGLSSLSVPITIPSSMSQEEVKLLKPLRLLDRSRVQDLLRRLSAMQFRNQALPTKARPIFRPEVFPDER